MSGKPPTEGNSFAAFRHFSWRINLAVIVGLGMLSLPAWRQTIMSATATDSMGMPMAQMGTAALGEDSPGTFLAMWVMMQTAMMLPTIAPLVLVHLAVSRHRGNSTLATLAFVGGYMIAWAAIGIVPLLAILVLAMLSSSAAATWLPMLAGVTLALAGAYQFTVLKQTCLDRCVSPLSFLMRHQFGRGVLSELVAGVVYGGFCIGCCCGLCRCVR